MNWDKVVVTIQPKASDKRAKEFTANFEGKIVGNEHVFVNNSTVVKHVGTLQSVRGDASVDVKNRRSEINSSVTSLKRSLMKVSRGFGHIMLTLGSTLCNAALLCNLHTHTRITSTALDKLSNKVCGVYKACLGSREKKKDDDGVWSRKSNTDVYLSANQLGVPHKLSISRLRLLARVLWYAPHALLYSLDEHCNYATLFAKRIARDLDLARRLTDIGKDLPPPPEDWAAWA